VTTYTWHIPTGSSAGASGIPASETRDQVALLFGRDIWFDVRGDQANYIVTPAGDWLTVEGTEALRQSLLRRTITNPGEWTTLPDFGVGARMFLKARNVKSVRDELAERIRSQYLRDDRVEAVASVTIEPLDNGEPGIRVAAVVVPKGRLRPTDTVLIQLEVT
jgi:hypothetical protein